MKRKHFTALIVTCTSMHSRNRRAGILIGQGKTAKEAMQEVALCFAACNTEDMSKDDSGNTEVGLWYGYNTPDSKEDASWSLTVEEAEELLFALYRYYL
mgnify:CR=1 FL=1